MDFYLFGENGYSSSKIEVDFQQQTIKVVLEENGSKLVGGQSLSSFEANLKDLLGKIERWKGKKNGKV